MTIKHLVLSGGGPIMIQILGAIQELERNKYFNVHEIESIYGTSAGAVIGIMISLQFEWETLNDYIIKRPWHDVFTVKVQHILDAYSKRGIFDYSTIQKCFKPLFDAKNISLDITMEEFYQLTKKDIHLYTFEVNEYKLEDISHTTHPSLPLLTAVQMTCAIPVLISPIMIGEKCYMDGGVACNYPLQCCIESGKSVDEIIGFKNYYIDDTSNAYVNTQSSLLDYLLYFLFKAVFNINAKYIQPVITNEVLLNTSRMSYESLKQSISNIEVRKELFEKGKQCAIHYLREK